MTAPPASATTTTRDGAFLAHVLALALSLGLPDPDYITMSPRRARSTTVSAVDFQFNDRNGQDPLPALRAWAARFGVTVDVSAGAVNPSSTWHQFDFTHAGVRFHAYAEIKAPSIASDEAAVPERTLREQRLQAVREGSPAIQDGPYAYMRQDGYMAGEGITGDDTTAMADDEPLPDCACGDAEAVHEPQGNPIATGPCSACECDGYRLPQDDSPFADPRHDPDAAWAAGDDNPLRIAGGTS